MFTKPRLLHRRGTRAAQPAANGFGVGEGTLYYVTDEGVLERSNGAAWQAYASTPAAGTLTGALTTPRIPYASAATVLTDSAALLWSNTPQTLQVIHGGGALDAPETNAKPMIHVGGDFDGVAAGIGVIYIDGYGAQGNFTMRRANGTQASKTALAASDIIFNFRSYGWDGSAYGLGGIVRMIANGALSGSNLGQSFLVALTPTGATTAPAERFRITGSASATVGINVASPSAALDVRGTPVDIGYLVIVRPTSNNNCFIQVAASGSSNASGFAFTNLSLSGEWRLFMLGNSNNSLRYAFDSTGVMWYHQSLNVSISANAKEPTTGTYCLLFENGTAPTAMPTDASGLFTKDVTAGNSNLFAMNEIDEITQITGGLGYPVGQGGAVTQGSGSGKATGCTLSKYTGEITMNNATLNGDTTVSFTLTNTKIAASDVLVLNHVSGGTIGSYLLEASITAAGSGVITVRNITTGNLGEAIVIRFVLLRGAAA